jgi:predicted ArsR family transcriptional regulator
MMGNEPNEVVEELVRPARPAPLPLSDEICPATRAVLNNMSPAARTLLRHMALRRFPVDLGTASEETGLAPNAVRAAMHELRRAGLVSELTRPSDEGPQPAGLYEVTPAGRQSGRLLTE